MADAPKPVPPEDNPEDNYLGSPLANPFKHFEGDYKRLVRHKAMVRDASNAVKNYKEVEAETARGQKKDSTPTVAEDKRIKQQMADDKQDADNARGATSGFTTRDRMGEKFAKGGSIRGGGCEQRGKTKGRMV